jgi:CRISPR system Cascade subunit CasE
MFLSKLALNPRSRQVRGELADPYQMHRTILQAFPDKENGGPGRVLFRVDAGRDSGQLTLLVQSTIPPDWRRFKPAADYLLADPATKEFAPRFAAQQALVFRLRANPTVKRDGKRHGLFQEELQLAWLRRKAEAGGFRVRSARIVPEGVRHAKKHAGDRPLDLAFFSVLFEGALEVTNPLQAQKTLADGIGSAKGLGFGLLSLGRLPP